MRTPILGVVGRSNSGKTTLIERIIPELVRAGYRVATIKHARHGCDLDTEGKDSWRHKRAGARTAIVMSRGRLALFADVPSQMEIDEVRDQFLDSSFDLVIAEGWKRREHPKIVVLREQPGEVVVASEGTLAVVCDRPLDLPVPVFDPDDVTGVASLIMREFPRKPRARGHEGAAQALEISEEALSLPSD